MKILGLRRYLRSPIKPPRYNNISSIQILSMECSKCVERGLVSTIRPLSQGWTTTAWRRPFKDDQDRVHDHKIELTIYYGWCSKGHYLETKERYHCWCNWPNETKESTNNE